MVIFSAVVGLFLFSSMIAQFALCIIIGIGIFQLLIAAADSGRHQRGEIDRDISPIMTSFVASVALLISAISIALKMTFGLLSYYVLLTFGLALVLLLISWVSAQVSRARVYGTLALVILYSLILRGAVYFSYPSIVGFDPWFHARLTNEIALGGYVDTSYPGPAGIYGVFALFHVFSAEGLLIFGVNAKDAMFFTVGVAEALLPLWVFVLFRQFNLSNAVCLLAAFLAGVMSVFILWGWWLVPSGLGLIFTVILLAILFKEGRLDGWKRVALFSTVAIALSWTHPGATLIAILILVFYMIATFALTHPVRARPTSGGVGNGGGNRAVVRYTLFLTAIIFIHAIQSGTTGGLIRISFTSFSEGTIIASGNTFARGAFALIWDRLPNLELLVLATTGFLILIRNLKKKEGLQHLGLSTVGLFLGLLILGLLQLNPDYPLDERMLAFSFVCILGISGTVLWSLNRTIPPSVPNVVVALIICFVLVLPSITNYSDNLDPPFPWSKTNNRSLTQNEIAAGGFVMKMNSSVYTDNFYCLFFEYYGYGDKSHVLEPNDNPLATTGNFMILARDRGPEMKVSHSWSLVFNSGQVKGYV